MAFFRLKIIRNDSGEFNQILSISDLYAYDPDTNMIIYPLLDRYDMGKAYKKKTVGTGVGTDSVPWDSWVDVRTLVCHLDVSTISIFDGADQITDLERGMYMLTPPKVSVSFVEEEGAASPSSVKNQEDHVMNVGLWRLGTVSEDGENVDKYTNVWLVKKVTIDDNHDGTSRVTFVFQTYTNEAKLIDYIEPL